MYFNMDWNVMKKISSIMLENDMQSNSLTWLTIDEWSVVFITRKGTHSTLCNPIMILTETNLTWSLFYYQ